MTSRPQDSRSTSSKGEVRNTRQRRVVLETLDVQDGFLSAQQLHRIIEQNDQKVSLATVYRILQSLEDHGQVDVLQSPEGQAIYRQCDAEVHHHHLLCRNCGAAEEISADAVEAWTESVAAQFGFTDTEHTVEIRGLCARCSRESSPRP